MCVVVAPVECDSPVDRGHKVFLGLAVLRIVNCSSEFCFSTAPKPSPSKAVLKRSLSTSESPVSRLA
ncbi:hypothetical protein KFK09_018287 [Dendrobium nobile]|uniref:Uncharacterized protein n=1 Tax=Dendrobium nobile TaxID=94219 RepID=A0A8T3AUV0_DENNO|nr:hypothetical protein KFK09_018287 [Dendrobium nobile]